MAGSRVIRVDQSLYDHIFDARLKLESAVRRPVTMAQTLRFLLGLSYKLM